MSKISVFKFNINNYNSNENSNIIHNIIGEYLGSRGFYYNQEKRCYMTGQPTSTAKNIAVNIGMAVSSAALTGGTRVVGVQSLQRGFEFQINGNQLIIKAYLIDSKFDAKHFIHSTFNNSNAAIYYYSDIKQNLFKKLEANNIIYVSKEVEKINDGSGKKYLKILLIIMGIMILPLLLLIIVDLLTT